jgi:hypothetical protein
VNLPKAVTTSPLAIVVMLTLGMGSDVDILTGHPHEVHTDERMIEEQVELGEAAPHTLTRFQAGSA